jgi:autotransporter translocation and assembly factor TamB
MRRLLRTLFRFGTALVVVGLTLIGLVMLLTRTDWGQDFIRRTLVTTLREAVDVRLGVGRLAITPDLGVEAWDVTVAVNDDVRVGAAHVRASLALPSLLGRVIHTSEVWVDGLRLRIRIREEPDDGEPHWTTKLPRLRADEVHVRDGRMLLAFEDADGGRRVFGASDIALDGSGAADPQEQTITVESSSLRPRGLAVPPIGVRGELFHTAGDPVHLSEVVVTTTRSTLHADVDLDDTDAVYGRVDLAPLWRGDLRALVPPEIARGENVVGVARVRGPWRALRVATSLDLGAGGRVQGRGVVDLVAEPPRHAAAARLDGFTPATDPPVTLSGTVRLHGRGLRGRAAGALSASGAVTVGHARLRLAGDAGADPLRARLDVDATGLVVEEVAIEHAAAELSLADRVVAVGRAGLVSSGLEVSGSGRVGLDGHGLALDAVAKATHARLAPNGVPLALSGTATVHAAGSVTAANVTLDARLADIAVADVTMQRATIAGTLRDVGGAAPAGSVSASLAGVAAGGLRDVGLDLGLSGTRRGESHLALTIQSLALDLQRGGRWTLAQPGRAMVDDRLHLDPLRLVSGAQRVTLAGTIGTQGRAEASVEADAVRLEPLCALFETTPCGGTLAARVQLGGTASAPRLTATAHVDEIGVSGATYGALEVSADYADRTLRASGVLDTPGLGKLDAAGTLPVDLAWAERRATPPSQPFDVSVRTDGLDLGFVRDLNPHAVRRAAGTVTGRLRVQGPWADPTSEGTIALRGGVLELAALRVPYRDITLELRAAGARWQIETLHAGTGQGTVDGGGAITLGGDGLATLDLHATLHEFQAVRDATLDAAISGDLHVTGTALAPVLDGDLAVARATFRPTLLPTSQPDSEPDPTVEVVGGTPEPAPKPPTPVDELTSALALDLRIALGDDAWVRSSEATIQLGGAIRVQRETHGPLRLTGEVRLRRGTYFFQGRRFSIEPSTITFDGAAPPAPRYDVTAVYRINQYRIEVRVTGAGAQPHLDMRSEPALSQTDILAVLLFGKPTDELGRGQSASVQAQAIQLASGYVMPELRESLMNTFGIDTFDVSMGNEAAGEPGQVQAGRYISQDVFVSIAQEFGMRAGQVLSVEYAIRYSISVRGSVSTVGTGALDLLWRRRY